MWWCFRSGQQWQKPSACKQDFNEFGKKIIKIKLMKVMKMMGCLTSWFNFTIKSSPPSPFSITADSALRVTGVGWGWGIPAVSGVNAASTNMMSHAGKSPTIRAHLKLIWKKWSTSVWVIVTRHARANILRSERDWIWHYLRGSHCVRIWGRCGNSIAWPTSSHRYNNNNELDLNSAFQGTQSSLHWTHYLFTPHSSWWW